MIEVDTSLLEANGREVWREGGALGRHEPGGFNGYVLILFALAFENTAPVDKCQGKSHRRDFIKPFKNVQL